MRGALVALLMVLTLGLATSAAHADRTVRLKATFQGQQATASVTVPDDWQGDATGGRVKLVAPSSRKGCDHILRLRLGLLYVAGTVMPADWVASRLAGEGPVLAMGGDAYRWGVAGRTGRRTAVGYGALIAGSGRYGRILAEVRGTTELSPSCRTAQSAAATKRLTRVLQGLALQSAKRKR